MLNVFAIKEKHTVYECIREVGAGIEHDINIFGLDAPQGTNYNLNEIHNMPTFLGSARAPYTKPFFLYLEEIVTFEESGPFSLQVLAHSHPNFLGCISHIKDTCTQLFTKYGINCYHLPLSSHDKDRDRISRRIKSLADPRKPVTLVSWGSWNDVDDANWANRGIVQVDDIAYNLLRDGSNIKLIAKTKRQLRCEAFSGDSGRVCIQREYLHDQTELDDLFYEGDLFLLPSRQVHSASLTNAFSFGMPCVTSNGWGMSEYCFDNFNSLVGYRNSNFAERIKDLCDNRERLIKMSENTLAWYNSNHSRENHKANLHRLVDLAMSRHAK